MRRPVVNVNGELADDHKFFAGQNIAYSKRGAFNITPANTQLFLDTLWRMEGDHQACNVAILETPKTLEQHKIDPRLYSQIKNQVEQD